MWRNPFRARGATGEGVGSGVAAQADLDRQFRSWPPRRIASWSLMLLGAFIAAQHLVAHGGFGPLPISMGWQDILVGYPMGMVLAIAGAVLIDPRPRI